MRIKGPLCKYIQVWLRNVCDRYTVKFFFWTLYYLDNVYQKRKGDAAQLIIDRMYLSNIPLPQH